MLCERYVTHIFSLKNIFHFYLKLWLLFKSQLIINSFIGLLSVALNLILIWTIKFCIDSVTTNYNSISIFGACTFLLSILLIKIILIYYFRCLQVKQSIKAKNKFQRIVFIHLLNTQWNELKKYECGDLLHRLEYDSKECATFMTQTLPAFITTSIQLIAIFSFLFVIYKQIAFLLLILIPIIFIIGKFHLKKIHKITFHIKETESKIDSILQETIQHRTLLKCLEETTLAIKQLQIKQDLLEYQTTNKIRETSMVNAFLNIGFVLCFLMVFIGGLYQLKNAVISFGMFIALLQLVEQIENPIRNLTKFFPLFIKAYVVGQRITELEKLKKEEQSNIQLKGNLGLCINHLSFGYTPKLLIIKESTFTIPPASKVAFIGKTGVGKTSFLRLILGLIEPQKGKLSLINGNSKEMISPLTRCNIAYTPQNSSIFSGTIKENLLLGNPNASKAELMKAINLAKANFIFSLKEKLDTKCGQNGEMISEGQAHRIALARSILRNKKILLLDEATAALDEKTEKEVIKNLLQNKSQTIIFITHRLSVTKYFTHILEFSTNGHLCLKRNKSFLFNKT